MSLITKSELEFSSKITFEEYNQLRRSVDWTELSLRQFNMIVKNSLFFNIARIDGEVVGTTRCVGDGGYHFFLCDVIVKPQFQGQGIGRKLVESFFRFVDDTAEKDETIMLTLVAAKDKEPFYKKFGFIERPTAERGAGMYMFYEKK